MALVAKDEGGGMAFDPAPEGLHRAVCVDVIDMGMQPTPWGEKHKVKLIWEVEAEDVNGKRFQVRQTYTLSLNEKAKLSEHLESWRGKKFTDDERIEGFDLDKLKGLNCQLQLIHNTSQDKKRTYANIQAIIAPVKGVEPLRPRDYKPDEHEAQSGRTNANGEDLPF